MKEILGIFLEDTPNRLAQLRTSREKGDTATFTRAAHSVKGSSGNVGANELHAVAEKIETHAKHSGLVETDALIAEIEAAFARVEVELRKLVA